MKRLKKIGKRTSLARESAVAVTEGSNPSGSSQESFVEKERIIDFIRRKIKINKRWSGRYY